MWAPLEALAAAGYKREQRLFSASLGEKGGQDTGIPSLRAAPGLQGCDSALPEGMEEMKWGEHQALCPAAPRVLWVSRSGSSPIAVPGLWVTASLTWPQEGMGAENPSWASLLSSVKAAKPWASYSSDALPHTQANPEDAPGAGQLPASAQDTHKAK